MGRLRPALAAVTGVLFLLAGCGGTEQPAANEAPPPATSTPADDAPASAEPPAATAKAPAKPAVPEKLRFKAETVDGKHFRGASLAGKPAVLWFWAPWCSNCQAEAPDIAEAAKSSKAQFVGVAAQDEVPAMQDFVSRFELGSFPHLADTDAAIWKRFGVTQQPAYAFIRSNGKVEVEKNILDKDELMSRVSALR